jgi:thioredoxin
MTTPIAATDQEFAQAVLDAEGLVMVEFWATWCASCRLVAPILDELAVEYAGRVAIVKVNVDENPDYASQYQVQRTPTIVFFRDGVEVDRIVGAGKKAHYTDKLEALLG